jgi:hypothetical protein
MYLTIFDLHVGTNPTSDLFLGYPAILQNVGGSTQVPVLA